MTGLLDLIAARCRSHGHPQPVHMLMSGKPGDVAFADIRSIGGLSGDVNRKLSQQICKMLTDSLSVSPDRVYLNFTAVVDQENPRFDPTVS